MRPWCSMWLLLASGHAAIPAAATAEGPATAAEVLADAPTDLSVTVYRAPYRSSGSIDLDRLQGFALVSELRAVHLPAGESRLRFEGVADGIEPASAIVTGLDHGVVEKNRDAALLSPAALVAAAVGKPVVLLRTHSKTGKLERLPGRLLADAEGGVVFETSQGIEGLRCAGLAESFSFSPATGLSATPTLSLLVRSPHTVTTMVTLSYLARGFDWAADYSATLSADGRTMDLGAWVTLANGNGVGFPAAHTQVVAGRVNRESGELQPIDIGGPVLARCWPRGSTSDSVEYLQIDRAAPLGGGQLKARAITQISAMAAPSAAMDAALRVEQEQLGDLKLYRVPDRTTVASRQSKQVRLLDRMAVPITEIYGADLAADDAGAALPAFKLMRTVNSAANHLGLPLPSGSIAVFARHGGERLLERESDMRDLAVDEEVEINLGASPDVELTVVKERGSVDAARDRLLPLVPGVQMLRSAQVEDIEDVKISNARATQIQFELRLRLREGARVVRADHPLGTKNGRPIFRLAIPAQTTVTVRYQTRRAAG
jgi:hypothetical protein